MKVDFLNLKRLNEAFHEEFKNCFSQFIDSGYYILGNSVKSFEDQFANYCGVESAIGVGNGYDALFLIFRGYLELGELKKGDHVIVAANTYIATILAIYNAGLVPVLVEPSDRTFNLDANLINEKITSKTKAILVTHLYGQLADMHALRSICSINDLLLISDSAQAHGAADVNGKKAGALADASGFSFYPTKNLGCLGDGGAITTNNKGLDCVIRQLRNYGTESKYLNNFIGVNSRLDEIQASVLLLKINTLDKYNLKRIEIAKKYYEGIKNDLIELPYWSGAEDHVFHLFVIRSPKREALKEYLKENGIGVLIHYPIPTHKQKAFASIFKEESYPITEKQSEEVLSLPLSPIITDDEIDYVIEVINSFE